MRTALVEPGYCSSIRCKADCADAAVHRLDEARILHVIEFRCHLAYLNGAQLAIAYVFQAFKQIADLTLVTMELRQHLLDNLLIDRTLEFVVLAVKLDRKSVV